MPHPKQLMGVLVTISIRRNTRREINRALVTLLQGQVEMSSQKATCSRPGQSEMALFSRLGVRDRAWFLRMGANWRKKVLLSNTTSLQTRK